MADLQLAIHDPGGRRMPLARFAAALLLAAAVPAAACDFCMGPMASASKGVRQADGVAAAKVAGRQFLFAGEGEARVATTFTVTKTLAGTSPDPGAPVRTTLQWKGARTAGRALLLFERTEDGPALLDVLADPDGRLAGYYAEALSVPAGRKAAFFATRLEDPDAEIAEDAYRQFSDVPFSALRSAKAALDAAKLREWLASDKVPAYRKGLYALMLGLAGEPSDADRLAGMLPAADSSATAGGLLAGVCLLRGKTAETLTAVIAGGATAATSPNGATAKRGALSVVRFLWADADAAGRAELRKVLAAGLADKELVPFVVDEFARLREDWMTDELLAVWADPKRRTGPAKAAILHYVRTLPEPQRTEAYKRIDAVP
jgi:hypothetical protein